MLFLFPESQKLCRKQKAVTCSGTILRFKDIFSKIYWTNFFQYWIGLKKDQLFVFPIGIFHLYWFHMKYKMAPLMKGYRHFILFKSSPLSARQINIKHNLTKKIVFTLFKKKVASSWKIELKAKIFVVYWIQCLLVDGFCYVQFCKDFLD